MDYSPIIPISKEKGSSCFYDAWKEGSKFPYINQYHGMCHGGSCLSLPKANVDFVYLYFQTAKSAFSEYDMLRYLEFCGLCGFPCEYEGVVNLTLKETYGTAQPADYHCVRLNYSDYVSPRHMGAGITAIRMWSYCLQRNPMHVIPIKAFEIMEALGEQITELQALLIAHYVTNIEGNNYMNNHTLNYDFSLPITKEVMLENAINGHGVNTIFRTLNYLPQTIINFVKQNNFEEILKLIK